MEYTEKDFKELQATLDNAIKEGEALKAKLIAVPQSVPAPSDIVTRQELADFIEGTLEISATGESIAKAVLGYYKVLQK